MEELQRGGMPQEHIPTEVDLCGWMAAIPLRPSAAAIKQLDAVLADLKKLNEEVFFQGENPEQYHWMWDSLGGHRLVFWAVRRRSRRRLQLLSRRDLREYRKSVHRAWLAMPDGRPDHPLAPIVKSWQQRPSQVEPINGVKGLSPKLCEGVRYPRRMCR